MKKVDLVERFMGRLDCNCDLLEGITDICKNNNIKSGRIEAIGSVKTARLGFYDQKKQIYQFFQIDQPLEIINLIGNVSLNEEKIFVHAHITLADSKGKTYGGHLSPGTIVFACELIVESYKGHLFERCIDKETGLRLWKT